MFIAGVVGKEKTAASAEKSLVTAPERQTQTTKRHRG
jgi:hypothetical protein